MRILKRTGMCCLLSVVIGGLGFPLSASLLDSERTHYDIRKWSSVNGLPQNLITSIAGVRGSYLWLGTQEGLIRFNGAEFSIFNSRNVSEMSDNHITALRFGKEDTLWIGTNGGGLLGMAEGRFFRSAPGSEMDKAVVNTLAMDPHGKVWIGTGNQGLFVLDPETNRLMSPKTGLPLHTQVDCVFVDSRENLWVAVPGALLKGYPGTLMPVEGLPPGISTVNTIIEDNEDNIWVGTANHGLFRIQGKRIRQWKRSDGLPSETVHSLLQVHTGEILAGTASGTARLIRKDDFRSVLLDERLENVIVTSMHQDGERNLWMGSYTGLFQNITTRVHLIDESDGLPENLIWGVYEDNRENLWLGLQSRGLVRISNKGDMRHFTMADGLPSNVVRTVMKDRRGHMWLGTANGLALFENGAWRKFPMPKGLVHNTVRALFEDSRGTLWIGTNTGIGILRNNRVTRANAPDEIMSIYIFSFQEDQSGTLWVATGKGVWTYSAGSWQPFGAGSELEGLRVFDIYLENSHSIWFGTQGEGLCHWNGEQFKWYTRSEGLLDNVVFKILPDHKDNIWLTSNKGIMAIPRKQFSRMDSGKILRLAPQYFGFDPGRSVLECAGGSQSSGMMIRSGLIVFPTILGVAIIDPGSAISSGHSPPIRLEQILADNQPLELSGSPELPSGTGNLEFRFAALVFAPATMIQYRYRLEGYDRQWQEVGVRRRAYYTNLSPGKYTFHVSSTRYDGTWSDQEAVCSFSIQSWYYQTWWFLFLAAMALVALISLIFWLRVKSLVRRKAELEHQVEMQTRKLKELSLKDPLTGLQNRRFVSEVTQKEIKSFIKYKKYVQSHKNEGRRANAENSVFGVYLFDIDHFKAYNDRFGHHEGDRLLVEFSGILTSSVREDDIVVRWGGEEFLLILKKTIPEYLDTYALKILNLVGTHLFQEGESGVPPTRITCSLGYCEFPFVDHIPDLMDLDSTIRLADIGMYMAKRNGRNMAARVINEARGPDAPREMHQKLLSGEFRDEAIPGLQVRFMKGPSA